MRTHARFLIRALRQRTPLIILACGAALIVVDLVSDLWVDYPMIAAFLSGFVFLAMALAIVNTWTKEQALASWQRVGRISLKALRESVEFTRDQLVMFLQPAQSERDNFPSEATEQRRAKFESLVHEPLPGADPNQLLDRLDALFQEPRWVEAAYRELRCISTEARAELGRWAPIVVESERLTGVLSKVGVIADALEDLHRPLGPAHRTSRGIADPHRREFAARLWYETILCCAVLSETINAELGRVGWKTAGRRHITGEYLATLEAHHPGQAWEPFERLLTATRDTVRSQYDTVWATQAARGEYSPTQTRAPEPSPRQ